MKDALHATLLTLLRVVRSQKVDGLAVSWVQALEPLPDDTMRQQRLLESLLPLPDDIAVRVLDRLIEGTLGDHAHFRAVMSSFVSFLPLLDRLSEERLRIWRKLAGEECLSRALSVLSPCGPKKRYYAPNHINVNEALDDVPLGRRKSLARCLDRQVLERVLHDKHPDVIRILLNNPRLLERDVVKLSALQPTMAATLLEVFRHPRWSRRYAVRKALVCNPYAPVAAASGLLSFLLEQDLRDIARAKQLAPDLRAQAQGLLQQKRSRRQPITGEAPKEPAVVPSPQANATLDLAHQYLAILPGADHILEELEEYVPESREDEQDAEAFLASLPDSLELVPMTESEEPA